MALTVVKTAKAKTNPKPVQKTAYIIVQPSGKNARGVYKVCASRVGRWDSFYEVASCPNEAMAEWVKRALSSLDVNIEEVSV